MAEYGRLIDGTVLEFERLLPGPIERVWEYFVNPDLRQKWFCAGKTDDHAGGTLTLSFDHTRISSAPPPKKYADDQGGDFDCEILVYEPPHRLDFSWPSEQGNPPTEVSVQLSERDGQVHLLLRHTRLESAEFINGASAGWHAHLDLLEDNLYGRKVTDFWPLHTALEDEYAWRLG